MFDHIQQNIIIINFHDQMNRDFQQHLQNGFQSTFNASLELDLNVTDDDWEVEHQARFKKLCDEIDAEFEEHCTEQELSYQERVAKMQEDAEAEYESNVAAMRARHAERCKALGLQR